MFKSLICLSALLPISALAQIPELIHCRNEDSQGYTVFHSFELTPLVGKKFDVRIYVSRSTAVGGDPHEEVSSEDPIAEEDVVLLDSKFSAKQEVEHEPLLYFENGGFLKIDTAETGSTVTLQLPGDEAETAQIIEHCVFPEPRAGVGN